MRSERPFELAYLVSMDIIAQEASTSIGGGSFTHRIIYWTEKLSQIIVVCCIRAY